MAARIFAEAETLLRVRAGLTRPFPSGLADILEVGADPILRDLLLRLLKIELPAANQLAQPALQLVFPMPAPIAGKRLGPEVFYRI